MLGQGCPWRGRCEQYKKETSFWKQNYCDNPRGYKNCAENPANYGNKEVQRQNEAVRQGGGMGAILLFGLLIFGACKLFGVF